MNVFVEHDTKNWNYEKIPKWIFVTIFAFTEQFSVGKFWFFVGDGFSNKTQFFPQQAC